VGRRNLLTLFNNLVASEILERRDLDD